MFLSKFGQYNYQEAQEDVSAIPEDSTPDELRPVSLTRAISPPLRSRRSSAITKSATAAVEAGEISVEDHVAFFSSKLLAAQKFEQADQPRLAHDDWLALYERNLTDRGHHFVIHQHDHPVAGTHYDLRLQCNITSSISFAIMYGLPGSPNSRRPNRNATETRVHNLWNHLIETASHETGSMLIWDTGEYEVLPYKDRNLKIETDTDMSDASSTVVNEIPPFSEPEKLRRAFQSRKVKLRLHGTRLPKGYTISLRLTHENYSAQQPKPPSRRRKGKQSKFRSRRKYEAQTSDSESAADKDTKPPAKLKRSISSLQRFASPPVKSTNEEHYRSVAMDTSVASDNEHDAQAEAIRLTNSYPGANNSIGSIHQRRWFLSLDRAACGFVPSTSKVYGQKVWTRRQNSNDESVVQQPNGFERFFVLGRDYETSVVTGRTAKDILVDEGVEGYVPRGKWRAVVE